MFIALEGLRLSESSRAGLLSSSTLAPEERNVGNEVLSLDLKLRRLSEPSRAVLLSSSTLAPEERNVGNEVLSLDLKLRRLSEPSRVNMSRPEFSACFVNF
jgi:hypothetical protein